MVCKENLEKVKNILDSWNETNDGREAISKEFKFLDFKEAFSFISMIALKSEQINHHPELYNVYNKVKIVLTTHDVDGLSLKDIELGKFIDDSYKRFNK